MNHDDATANANTGRYGGAYGRNELGTGNIDRCGSSFGSYRNRGGGERSKMACSLRLCGRGGTDDDDVDNRSGVWG
ncbi:hypothetical protein [Bifidobacterium myosotis]|uniref:hypothetical protein n=1 Tax=Bifidobacterium myosotis TaxID=1630166 RepID=UPI0014720754|nr:hypothetical protein [Bifidobacterium myosotis]